ncbi:MAG: prepilin peptidase [Clostridia bacterium]|nr:prepilin peptidase [Clostridia bacterium]
MKHIIIYIAICAVYYNIGGLATTNILRLTAGNTLSVNNSRCVCDNCGAKISPFLQLPIISYIVCKGKCRNCKAKIPIYSLFLEITVFLGMSLISFVFDFSMFGVALSFIYYEAVRIVVVCVRRKRTIDFVKQYLIAVASMILFFAITESMALLNFYLTDV